MISDILDYVESYDDVRAVLGLPSDELKDDVLALTIYKNYLGLALNSITGTYPLLDPAGDRTLIEIFAAIDDTDPMYSVIQMFSTYTVADCIAGNLPMIGVKTKSDGKSVATRHSPESVYLHTIATIKEELNKYITLIKELLEVTVDEIDLMTTAAPVIDPITGE